MEGQIKCFLDKVKLKEFIITKQLLYETLKELKKKMIKTVNSKMAINSQLSTSESKNQTKQTCGTEIESYVWRSFGGLSAGRGTEKNGEKGAGIKKHKLVGTEWTGGC